jgi:hypothetical protein
MVAYSFQQQFVLPIRSGRKRQTIRADRKRHARPGEHLQLYSGMRTKHCQLIGRATCLDVREVTLCFDDSDPEFEGVIMPGPGFAGGLEEFARADGFSSWPELKAFWRAHHPGVDRFSGVLITWGDLDG